MTRHLHIDLRPPVDYVLDATADESECTEEMGRHSPLSRFAPSLKKSRPIGFDRGRVVKAFCLAVAVFNVVFWGGQLLRGVL